MERFIRGIRGGTEVQDREFPNPDAVHKPLYLEGERRERGWSERKLRGFAAASRKRTGEGQEGLEVLSRQGNRC